MDFTGKVILITGASSGIGANCACYLAKLGGKIALVGRNETRLNDIVGQIKANGSPEPLAIAGDVTTDAESIINKTISHFGKLDVLVNCAGIARHTPFVESNISLYDEMMNVNVRSAVLLSGLAVQHLEKTKGNIVNVSSIASLVVLKNMTFYCMSKAALDQFTKNISVELGPQGIRVNSVNPGIVDTPIFQASGINDEQKVKMLSEIASQSPLRRYAEASDVTYAIAYLASNLASCVTGIQLCVDGGATVGGAY